MSGQVIYNREVQSALISINTCLNNTEPHMNVIETVSECNCKYVLSDLFVNLPTCYYMYTWLKVSVDMSEYLCKNIRILSLYS